MEPRFNERGRTATHSDLGGRMRASMEPRFNERGRRSNNTEPPTVVLLLQWSLASMSEEGTAEETVRRETVRLQWSLASMSEEGPRAS